MIGSTFFNQSLAQGRRLVTAALALLLLASPINAQETTMETLLDRIQIEDLLVRYYYELSQGNAHEMAEYFTADALLDVDGMIAVGHDEIAALYTNPEGSEEAEAR
ncbi:MAG: SnoaL-like domain-containing protein, partial [Gammaproteobacteria bacterium]|nr:SnoaL-like domain-containing protein [Gammaproteobacteria bacterium]